MAVQATGEKIHLDHVTCSGIKRRKSPLIKQKKNT